jgi:hypothetical protein
VANEYKVRLDEGQYKELYGMLEFASTVLPQRDSIPARSLLTKMEHAREFPTLGRFELVATTREKNLLETLSGAFKMNLEVPRITS